MIENIIWSTNPVSNICQASSGVCEDIPMWRTIPFSFISKKIVQRAVFLIILPVRFFIETVDKSIINVISLDFPQLPVYLALDGFQIGCPAIFTGFVIGAKMDLIENFSPY